MKKTYIKDIKCERLIKLIKLRASYYYTTPSYCMNEVLAEHPLFDLFHWHDMSYEENRFNNNFWAKVNQGEITELPEELNHLVQ